MRGDTKCSFFSAARRTNQEAPPLLSGRGGRGRRHRRGLRNSLRSDSPRPLSFSGLPAPCPIKAGFCGSSIFSPHSALSGIFLSAFSHRPEGLCALAAMSSTLCAGHRVMPHFDAASRDTDKIIRKIHFLGPRIAVRGDTLCHAAFDAVTKSSRTPMRDPENTVFGHPVLQCSSLVMPPSMRSPVIPSSMRTVSSRTPMRDPENTVCTPRETVRTVGMHGLCILPVIFTRKGPCPRFPFSFPAKEKGKPKESSRLMSES